MEDTQSFRLIGEMEIMEITISHIGGQNIVLWEDIEQVFPGVTHVQSGNVTINRLKDSDGNRIVPQRITHRLSIVLDVVLSSTVEYVPVDSSMAISRMAFSDDQAETPTYGPFESHRPGAIVSELNVNPPISYTATLAESVSEFAITTEPFTDFSSAEPRQATMTRASTTHIQSQLSSLTTTIELARQSGKPLTSEALSSLIASQLTPLSMAKPGFERTVIHKLDGLYNQGAMTQQIARGVWKLQKQMNDRLILIQSKTEAS
ncbi:hypothetical protein EC957_010172 [Mortierella hygrophila]|uniref:Uncharacterized protein n=1 Tax=Mortierella hygrophila TaxID=979708 RepID=A0A9P6JX20_9FUNG|nr:hypothetical protein EC957_010172 [Mortierella hygrophila]